VSSPDVSDRRVHPRAKDPDVTARITTKAGSSDCAVENISAGGARLVASLAPATGERVQVRLAHPSIQPMTLAADVVRAEPLDASSHVIAIKFASLSDPIHDAIQRIVLRALERQRATARRTVLVVDDDAKVRAALERELNRLGYVAIAVAMPLEAVRCLQDPATNVEVAIVDLGLGQADGLDVIAYVAEQYPHVRRVVMSGQRIEDLAAEVAAGRAHAALEKPWQRGTLASVLGGR
jgi:CheY-like chemotaxis protein